MAVSRLIAPEYAPSHRDHSEDINAGSLFDWNERLQRRERVSRVLRTSNVAFARPATRVRNDDVFPAIVAHDYLNFASSDDHAAIGRKYSAGL